MVSKIFYVHPYLGKIPILTHIFQMPWNHQPQKIFGSNKLPPFWKYCCRQPCFLQSLKVISMTTRTTNGTAEKTPESVTFFPMVWIGPCFNDYLTYRIHVWHMQTYLQLPYKSAQRIRWKIIHGWYGLWMIICTDSDGLATYSKEFAQDDLDSTIQSVCA